MQNNEWTIHFILEETKLDICFIILIRLKRPDLAFYIPLDNKTTTSPMERIYDEFYLLVERVSDKTLKVHCTSMKIHIQPVTFAIFQKIVDYFSSSPFEKNKAVG